MSTTATSSPTSASASSTDSTSWVGGAPSGGVSSSLYLFTFLITIVVLAVISAALLFRAYYVRRQFQRQVEEAIRAGQPLPQNAAQALGLVRPIRGKKEKQHGPMPGMWETEMWRDGERWQVGQSEKGLWDDITPLCMTHPAPPPPPPEPVDLATLMPQRRGPWFLRPFLSPRMPDLSTYVAQHPNPNRPMLNRTLTTQTLPPVKPAWTIPYDGEQVVVGVMIAMPVEGKEAEKWDVYDENDVDEMEVPNVCLGVMEAEVKNH